MQLLEKWLISRQIVNPLLPINVLFLLLTALSQAILVHGVQWSDGMGFLIEGLGFRGAPIATFFCATAKVKTLNGAQLSLCRALSLLQR